MWFKYGLKVQKLLEAARPGLGASALSGRVESTCESSVSLQQKPKDIIEYGMETTHIKQALRTGAQACRTPRRSL